LDSTSIKGIFIGYSLSSKTYIIYIKEGIHIKVSKDVIFDENHAYKESKDIPIDYSDEEVLIFEEEEVHHENPTTNQEQEEGASDPIQLMVVPTIRK